MAYPVMPSLPISMAKGLGKKPNFNSIGQETAAGVGNSFVGLKPYPTTDFEFDLDNIQGNEALGASVMSQFMGTFMACGGRAVLFQFTDPQDNQATNMTFGTGDGSTVAFQLSRQWGGATDIIQNPVGSINIYVDGVLTAPASVSTTGVVTFSSAPANGATLTWTGAFCYLCRFAADTVDAVRSFTTNNGVDQWNISSIKFSSEFVAAGSTGVVFAGGGGGGFSTPAGLYSIVTNPSGPQTINAYPLYVAALGSETANSASSGFITMANIDTINWRNAGNTGNLALGVNSSNQLTFGGAVVSGDYFNVLTYGADPTGTADSSTAFQNAINAAVTGTGTVFVPTGIYKIGTVLTDAAGLQGFIGEGETSKLQVPSSSSTNAILNFTSVSALGFKLKGLQFQGPGQSTAHTQIGVTVGNSGGNIEGADISDLWFTSWSNYGLEIDAPIMTRVTGNRFLNSQKGVYYNGGTSVTAKGNYGLNVTKVVHDINGTDYSSWEGNANDACGLAFLTRGTNDVVGFRDNGHERGTASNVTVTNVALTTNVATVTYTGTDLSVDWSSGMTVVIAGTSSTSGLFNGRQVPTSVTSSTVVYALTHADVASASDSGTASLFSGDGIEASGSIAGLGIDGFYGTNAQQTTSTHVVLAGTVSAATLNRLVSTAGGGSTQTIDLYIGLNCSNLLRTNTNLLGGVTNLGSQGQTLSNNSWTVGNVVSNSGTVATSGKIRLNDAETLSWRNNGNSADLPLGISANDFLTYNSAVVPQQAVAPVNLTGQTAAIASTNLIASAPVSGRYEIRYFAKITTVDTTSSTLGGSGGCQIGATSPTDSVAYTTQAGSTSTGNLTSSNVQGVIVVYAKAATAITYKMGYTAGTGNMAYEFHLTCHYLGA